MADPQPLPFPPTLPSAPIETLTRVLDTVFEPSVPLHTLSLPILRSTPFQSYPDLIAAIGVQLIDLLESSSTSDTEWLDKILGAHPRLGEKKVESALSRGEQAAMEAAEKGGEGGQGDGGDENQEEVGRELARLNERYEEVFPGLRYVYADRFLAGEGKQGWVLLATANSGLCRVFVNGRSRQVIMEDMRKRIERGDIMAERREAIRVSSYSALSLNIGGVPWVGIYADDFGRLCARSLLIEPGRLARRYTPAECRVSSMGPLWNEYFDVVAFSYATILNVIRRLQRWKILTSIRLCFFTTTPAHARYNSEFSEKSSIHPNISILPTHPTSSYPIESGSGNQSNNSLSAEHNILNL